MHAISPTVVFKGPSTYPKIPVQRSVLHVFGHNHGMFNCTHKKKVV